MGRRKINLNNDGLIGKLVDYLNKDDEYGALKFYYKQAQGKSSPYNSDSITIERDFLTPNGFMVIDDENDVIINWRFENNTIEEVIKEILNTAIHV